MPVETGAASSSPSSPSAGNHDTVDGSHYRTKAHEVRKALDANRKAIRDRCENVRETQDSATWACPEVSDEYNRDLSAAYASEVLPERLSDLDRATQVLVLYVEGFEPADSLQRAPELNDNQRRLVAAVGGLLESVSAELTSHLLLVRVTGSSDGSKWTTNVWEEIGSKSWLTDVAHQTAARQRCRSVLAELQSHVRSIRIEMATDHDVLSGSGPELRRVRIELWAQPVGVISPGAAAACAGCEHEIPDPAENMSIEGGHREPMEGLPVSLSEAPAPREGSALLLSSYLGIAAAFPWDSAPAFAVVGVGARGPQMYWSLLVGFSHTLELSKPVYGPRFAVRIGYLLKGGTWSIIAEPGFTNLSYGYADPPLHPRQHLSLSLGIAWHSPKWRPGSASLALTPLVVRRRVAAYAGAREVVDERLEVGLGLQLTFGLETIL
jgi:hypothetical protein